MSKLKVFLRSAEKYIFSHKKYITAVAMNLTILFIVSLVIQTLGLIEVHRFIRIELFAVTVIALDIAAINCYLQKTKEEPIIKNIIRDGFILLLLVQLIAIFLKKQMPFSSQTLLILTIIFGIMMFCANRNILSKIEEENRQELVEEQKRKKHFAQKFPKTSRIPYIGSIARHIYREGWGYTMGLTGIITLALSLRLNRIGTLDYWFDEFISMITAQSILDGTYPILPSETVNHRAGIYFHILAGFINVLGFNQFAGRILNVVFSVLIIYLLYIFGKHLFCKSTGLMSAFIYSISPLAIHIARDVRMYEMSAFFSILIIAAGYKCINDLNTAKSIKNYFKIKANWFYAGILIIAIIIGLNTHILLSTLVISFYIYFLYSYVIKRQKQYHYVILAGPIMFIGMIIYGYHSFNIVAGLSWLIKFGLGLTRPSWATANAPYHYPLLNLMDNSGLTIAVVIGLLFSILLTVYRNPKRDNLRYLMIVLSVSLILLAPSRLEIERYSYFLLPLFVLYFSYGLVYLLKLIYNTSAKKYSTVIILIILIVIINSNIHTGYNASNTPPWCKTVNFEEAGNIIKEISDENTTIFFNHMATPIEGYNVKATYYFGEKRHCSKNCITGTPCITYEGFKEYIRDNHNVVVAIRPWPSDITWHTRSFLDKNMKKIKKKETAIIIYHKE